MFECNFYIVYLVYPACDLAFSQNHDLGCVYVPSRIVFLIIITRKKKKKRNKCVFYAKILYVIWYVLGS